MIPVYQTMTVKNDGQGDCFNACVASILELPLRKICQVFPKSPGDWREQWRVWLADRGYKLSMCSPLQPPAGYSIMTVITERRYPDDHPTKAGLEIAHACVAFDGVFVHDPYPLPSEKREIQYFTSLVTLTDAEKALHEVRLRQGRCIHGYRSLCDTCAPLEA